MKTNLWITTVALTASLAACGGGGSSPDTPPVSNEVPASATASPTAYSTYAGSLVKSETAEPLDTSKVVPPTSESAAPIDVI